MYPARSTFLSTVDRSLWYFDKPADDPSGKTYLCQYDGWSVLRDVQDSVTDAALNGMLEGTSASGVVGHTPATAPAIPAHTETAWTQSVLMRMYDLATHYGLQQKNPDGMTQLATEINQNRIGQRLSAFTLKLALWLASHSRAPRTDAEGGGFLYNLGTPDEITFPYDMIGPKLGDAFRNPLEQEQNFGVTCQPVSYWREKNATSTSAIAFWGSTALLATVLGGSFIASRRL